jgi:predicted PurR-regulated permease PerM
MKKDTKTNRVIAAIRSRVSNLRAKAKQVSRKNVWEDTETPIPQVKVKMEKMVFEWSAMSVFKSVMVILAVVIGTYLLYSIGNILLLFFIAFFIASALDPLIDALQQMRIPRAIGILLVYCVIFVLVAILIANLLPLIASQLVSIATLANNFIVGLSHSPVDNLPFGSVIKPYLNDLYKAVDFSVVAVQLQNSLQLISTQLVNLGGNLWSIILQISNGLMNFILILILVFFMTVDEMALEHFCLSIFPNRYSEYISKRLQTIKVKIGEWIRGQLVVSVVAAVISFIGLAIFGVNYSLTIAVITGICMIIPVFGRVVACIIVLPIVLNQSPALALFLIIFYFGISQIENNILVPLLMNRAVGLSPILIIFALLVGFQFLGLLGLVLAIPIATIIAVFARDIGKRIYQSKESKTV